MQFSQRSRSSVHGQGTTSGTLFFTTTPPLQELCSVHISIPSSQKNIHGSVNSFQPQVIKCRELIFTEPEIIASPVMGNSGNVQIITQINVYKAGKLQSRFQRMNVEVSKPRRVTPCDYQTCLRYTLQARMAPMWNKVGNYLVQSREFVTSTQKLNAITVNLTVNESELYLNMNAFLVRSPPVTLEDLNICRQVVQEFLFNQEESASRKIDEYAIQNKWCHILPSMKKGMVVNIHRDIPEDSPFNSYKDVKKYWKNMYGYRLPESDEGMSYYQVYFKPIGHTLFTYPECCIRLRDVTIFNCPDSQQILQQFLADIHAKMPLLCGQRLQFKNKAMCAIPKLIDIQPEIANSLQLNLSAVNACSQRNQHRPTTQEKRINLYTPWKPSASQAAINSGQLSCNSLTNEVEKCQSGKINETTPTTSYSSQYQNSVCKDMLIVADSQKTINGNHDEPEGMKAADNDIHSNTIKLDNVTAKGLIGGEHLNYSPIKDENYTSRCPKKIVPIFKPKVANKTNINGRSECNNTNTPKRIPVFKGTQKPSISLAKQTYSSVSQNASNDMFSDMKRLEEKLGVLKKQSFSESSDGLLITEQRLNNTAQNDRQMPKFRTGNNNTVGACTKVLKEKIINNREQNQVSSSQCINNNKRIFNPRHTIFMTSNNNSEVNIHHHNSTVFSETFQQTANLGQTFNAYQNHTPSLKRKMTNEFESENKEKRQRAKPKVQEGIDIENLAKTNQLGKVNTLTLATWLKSRGIPCKSKDKKGELVEKVLQTLHLNVIEP